MIILKHVMTYLSFSPFQYASFSMLHICHNENGCPDIWTISFVLSETLIAEAAARCTVDQLSYLVSISVRFMCVCVYWLLNVTINDISVIHLTAQSCEGGLKMLIDISYSSLRCQSKHQHRATLLSRLIWETAHFSCLLRCAWRYGGPIPGFPQGSLSFISICINIHPCFTPRCEFF